MHTKDVVRDLVSDSGVAPDNVGQSSPFNLSALSSRKGAYIPEPISVSERFELVFENGRESFAQVSLGENVFG